MSDQSIVPAEVIERRIFVLRGRKVMLSRHLAELYGVEPKALIQAVKRNIERFPKDFMFQLSAVEYRRLKSQFVTSKRGGAHRALPFAFTEQGVAMLSSVLRSDRAIQVNIAIMRAFAHLRELLASHKEFAEKLNELESRLDHHDADIGAIFEAMRQLMKPGQEGDGRKIGY